MKNKDRIAAMDDAVYQMFLRSYENSPVQRYIDMDAWLESDQPEWVFTGYPAKLRKSGEGVIVVEEYRNGKVRIIIPHKNDHYEVCNVAMSQIMTEDDDVSSEDADIFPEKESLSGALPPVFSEFSGAALPVMEGGAEESSDAGSADEAADVPEGISGDGNPDFPAPAKDVPKKYKGHTFTEKERQLLDAGLAVDIDTDQFRGQVLLLQQRGRARRIMELGVVRR